MYGSVLANRPRTYIANGFKGFEPIALDDLIEAREVLIELLDEARRFQRLGQANEILEVGE